MAQITKIYELKTLGFDQLMKELKAVEASFGKIKDLKKQISAQKIDNGDAATLKKINDELIQQRIKTAELRLERQKLINEAKVEQNTRQAQINASRAATSAMQAEAGSYNDLTNKLKLLNALRKNLSPTSGSTVSFGGQNLNFQQAALQAQQLASQIRALGFNISGMGDIGNRVTSALSAGFQNMKGHLNQMILTYVSWFAAFREAGKLINENIKLSDSFADLQIRIKGTKEDVQNLFNELKKIDTRTSLKDLVDIANIISKKGVPAQDIAALTEEFDKLNVVLGSEIGEPSTATANIIKLITIFNEDKKVTAERIREIGTELFKLTTTGVATGEFLVSFAERVGAVRGITGLTLPNVLALGAALQQLGQRNEVAGTAAVQLTTRLFTDVTKFAKAAKVSVDDFRQTLKDNPIEALVQVAEGLKSLGDEELANGFEEVVRAFGEVGVTGVRIKAVLGDIATNGAFVRDRMKEATVTSADYARQSEAVELKQNTLAATLARVRKEFETIGTSRAVQVTLTAIGAAILFLVSNLGTIITVLAIYASAWTIANSAMIANRIAAIASNVAFTAQYALLVITTTWTRAYTAALGLFTGATNAATASTRLLTIALRLLPIGIIITLLALFVAGCRRATSEITGTTDALKKQAEQMRITQEINQRAAKTIAEQVSQYEALVKIVTNTNISYDTQRGALTRLIEMNGRFSAALKGNVIDLNEVKKALGEVRAEIELNARAQAGADLASQKYKDYLGVVTLRQKLETEFALGDGPIRTLTGLSREEIRTLLQGVNLGDVSLRAGGGSATFLTEDFNKIIEDLKRKEENKFNVYNSYNEVVSGLQKQIIDKAEERKKQNDITAISILENSISQAQLQKLSKNELDNLIKLIDEELDKLKEGDPKLAQLARQREAFQKRLDALKGVNPKVNPFRASRLTGDQKDDFAEIDADLNKALADLDTKFLNIQRQRELTLDEERSWVVQTRNINQEYLDQKIERLESEKSLNAKEQQVLAQFRKDRVELELKLHKDLQNINEKEFAEARDRLKGKLEQDIADSKLKVSKVENDPSTSYTERAQAKLDSDTEILNLQLQFNKDMDFLEKLLNQKTKTNTREGAIDILRTRQELLDDERALIQADLADIRLNGEKAILQYNIDYEKLRKAILDNDKLTVTQRDRALEILSKQQKYTIITLELKRLTEEFKKIEELYKKNLITEKEYLEKKDELQKKQNDKKEAERDLSRNSILLPSGQTSTDFVTEKLSKLFGFGEGSAEEQLLGTIIAQTFEVAQEAMNAYFDMEEQRVRDSLALTLQRLDTEKEQVKARAQSAAEIDSIEKQYAAKKAKAEREAGEKVKSIRRSEAKIALATELANIAVSAAANPANAVTFGAAGAIMYGILAALAVARYSLNISRINSEKFAFGGQVPTRGGYFGGKPHSQGGTPFTFHGNQYEAEVDEMSIIRTRNANPSAKYTISGTQAQIASMLNVIGGGISFKPGAHMRKFETGGLLGSRYSAPLFIPSTSSSSDIDLLRIEIRTLAQEQSRRIDRLQVVQVTDTVKRAIDKEVKQSSIGSL